VREACVRATAKTGALCFTVKARYLTPGDKAVGLSFGQALSYEPGAAFLRHQYGCTKPFGRRKDAIQGFTVIVDEELKRIPRERHCNVLTTRIINLKATGQTEQAREDLITARDYWHATSSRSYDGRLDELELK